MFLSTPGTVCTGFVQQNDQPISGRLTTLAVTSVNSLLCQCSTCLRIGSKVRCIRSTSTEIECLASTGVNTLPMAKMTNDGQT